MNDQPVQPISHNGLQATTTINTAQLADIAELLDILDGFLRNANDIADRLADYLHTTGRDQPQLPDCQRSRNSPGMRGCPSRNSSPSVT
jgi:ABC-type transporter Mla subunit MlaD